MSRLITRRNLLVGMGAGSLVLTGCDRLSRSEGFRDNVLSAGEKLSYRFQRLIGASSLAPEYAPSEMSPLFRTNGNTLPRSDAWRRHAETGFADWRLQLVGGIRAPQAYSLAQLGAKPARSQITRHDCVEGWSAIGKWTGVPLGVLLNEAGPLPDARYVVFHCADDFNGTRYYESIDLVDAFHPQTILAYGMNDGPLPVGHGAPLRLRVERQLGYKQAKFVMRVEVVPSLAPFGLGKGGYWEDAANYEWFAGV